MNRIIRKDVRFTLLIMNKKLFSPERGRIALLTNERITEILGFAIQVKELYVNKQKSEPNHPKGCQVHSFNLWIF